MARWADFAAGAPELAALAARLWPGTTALERGEDPPEGVASFAIAYLATSRRDGSARLHPFCPILAGGCLFAANPRSSPKGWDLRRDPRCAIHALPGPDDAELCLRARAAEVGEDRATRDLVLGVVLRGRVGGMVETVGHDALFEFDLERVDVASWVDVGQPGTHAVRRHWRAP